MDVAREAWTQELKLLTLAIDETVSVNDQLLICEHEILFNLNRSIALLQTGCSTAEFEQTSKQVVKRVARVCELVTGEIGNYEPCEFTARVLESVQVLRNQLMAGFVRCAGHSAHVTTGGQWEVSSGNEFIEHSRLVYDTVRELRQAVIQIPSQNGMGQLGSLVENEIDESTLRENEADRDDEGSTTIEPESVLDDGGNDNDDELDSNTTLIPSASSTTKEQLEEIQQQMAELRQEKTVFDREVLNKWDDTSNDIVVLSKAMCVILMDMGSFTRSRGPYKTLVEVIAAAKKISELGTKLEKLCRELANSCPESQSKKELLDYLKSLVFFCSQMNICVKVKENTIDVGAFFLMSMLQWCKFR
jgi:catenin alpha